MIAFDFQCVVLTRRVNVKYRNNRLDFVAGFGSCVRVSIAPLLGVQVRILAEINYWTMLDAWLLPCRTFTR